MIILPMEAKGTCYKWYLQCQNSLERCPDYVKYINQFKPWEMINFMVSKTWKVSIPLKTCLSAIS